MSMNPIADYSAVKGYYSQLVDKDFDVNVPDISTRDPTQLTPQEEDETVERLNALAVKNPIDGAFNDPYNLKVPEAIMFIIFNSTDDLSMFVNTTANVQKKFITQFVQNNYGDYLGCEVVHCYVICHSRKYAEADVGYYSSYEELNLKVNPEGEYMKVYKMQGGEFVEYHWN